MTVSPDKKQPRLILRPVFHQRLATVQALALGALGTLVLTVVGGTALFILTMLLGLSFIPSGYIYGLCFVAGAVLLPGFIFESRKKAYSQTQCRFYDDHLDYQYFRYYLTRQRGRIFYRDVEDVFQKSSFLQGQVHVTTITLYAPAAARQQGGFPGLRLADISDTQDFQSFITDLIDQSRRPRPPASAQPPAVQDSVSA